MIVPFAGFRDSGRRLVLRNFNSLEYWKCASFIIFVYELKKNEKCTEDFSTFEIFCSQFSNIVPSARSQNQINLCVQIVLLNSIEVKKLKL